MKHQLPVLMLFLSLSSIYTTANGSCDFTQITSAQVMSTSGTYCLANDIVGTLTIDADHVVLDLNGKEISGEAHGIFITSTHQCITIKNGFIKDTSQEGILVKDGSEIILKKLVVVNCGNNSQPYGIKLDDSQNCIVENCLIAEGFAGIALATTNYSFVQNCQVLDCTQVTNNNANGYLSSGLSNHFDNCAVVNLKCDDEARGFRIASDGEGAILTNCSARVLDGVAAIGFSILANCCILDTCISSDFQGTTVKLFNIDGSRNLIRNCIGQCSDAIGVLYGFHIQGNKSIFEGCKAIDLVCNGIAGTMGYYLYPTVNENVLQNCLAQRIRGASFARGFFGQYNVTDTLVTRCTAASCSDEGFILSGSSNTLIYCTAFNNGNNYNVGTTTSGDRKNPGDAVTAGLNIKA